MVADTDLARVGACMAAWGSVGRLQLGCEPSKRDCKVEERPPQAAKWRQALDMKSHPRSPTRRRTEPPARAQPFALRPDDVSPSEPQSEPPPPRKAA